MTTHPAHRSWTPLSRRLGVTRTAAQRNEILAALDRIDWAADIDGQMQHIYSPAARAIVAAVYHHRRDQLHLVGSTALAAGCQLIGIEHADGTRNYLLGMHAEAIHVLAEVPLPAANHRRVA